MHVLVMFLLLGTCDLSTSIGIYSRGNSELQSDFQSDTFFEKVRDWFANLRGQIHERLFGPSVTTSPLLSTEILNLDRSSLQKRFRNHEWLLLDLSTISFDPNRDWGFRIGNWYFIRKGFTDQYGLENNSDESDIQPSSTNRPKGLTEVGQTEGTFDTTKDPSYRESSPTNPTTIMSIINRITPIMTQETDAGTTIKSIENINLSENSPLGTDERLNDNEPNDNDFVRRGSVEVLMG